MKKMAGISQIPGGATSQSAYTNDYGTGNKSASTNENSNQNQQVQQSQNSGTGTTGGNTGNVIDTTSDKNDVTGSNYQFKGTLEEEGLKNIVEELNKMMSKYNANLEFSYHKEAGMFSVALVDKSTKEVIKELPPEEMLRDIEKAKIWMDAFIGTFVDEKA
jgi:flagellar protein FlaG